MKQTAILLLLVAITGISCRSTVQNIFGNKTPHEIYEDRIEDRGLDDTPDGRAWLAASEKALAQPLAIQLPYRQHGYFHHDKARALGLQFSARFGEQIRFSVSRKKGSRLVLFADIFEKDGEEALFSADTTSQEFHFNIEKTGSYILRLQPELFQSGEYELSVSVGPSIGFPVSGSKAKSGSFWGADRDGGKRSHEGIDIFAPKGTPVVAAADGYITGVREGGLGGKTVWLRTERNITLYYAHLDKQLVQEGQQVKKGDVLGTVGNTGNARTTPPHLHFGIYTSRGPVDPFPFVNKAVKKALALAGRELNTSLKLVKSQKTNGSSVKANTILVPLAATSQGYIAELPDGNLMNVPFSAVKKIPLIAERKVETASKKAAEETRKS